MTLQNYLFISMGHYNTGNIEVHKTVTKGFARYGCTCGSDVELRFRKELSTDYMTVGIKHRNKERKYSASGRPDEVSIFDLMLKVSNESYRTCKFPA